jgi:hypothetical protein
MVRPAQWWFVKLLFKGAKHHQTAGVTMTLGLKGVTKSDCMLEHLVRLSVLVNKLNFIVSKNLKDRDNQQETKDLNI